VTVIASAAPSGATPAPFGNATKMRVNPTINPAKMRVNRTGMKVNVAGMKVNVTGMRVNASETDTIAEKAGLNAGLTKAIPGTTEAIADRTDTVAEETDAIALKTADVERPAAACPLCPGNMADHVPIPELTDGPTGPADQAVVLARGSRATGRIELIFAKGQARAVSLGTAAQLLVNARQVRDLSAGRRLLRDRLRMGGGT
jgi:hypothetical protein